MKFMARYTGPKDKLSRREGFDLFGKGPSLTRLTVPPGMHGVKGSPKLSQYGKQLREKQKVKRIYGVLEKQFKNYVKTAGKVHGNSGEELVRLLETRLDNVVYRLGFAPSRPAARQLVGHGHVMVDGKRVTIPSFRVKPENVITISPRGLEIPSVAKLLSEKKDTLSWLERRGASGRILRLPKRDDVMEPIDEHTIVEYYSR